MPTSRPSRADVFDPGPGPAVSHELGSLVVEDEQVLVGLNQIDALPGEEPGDMEPGLADLNDSIGGDRGAADAIPANRADLVSWPRRVCFWRRLPRLLRGDAAGQSSVGSLSVLDLVEPVDLTLQLLEGAGRQHHAVTGSALPRYR